MRKNKSQSLARKAITALPSSIVIFLSIISYSVGAERLSYVVQARDSVSFLRYKIYGRFDPEMINRLSVINNSVDDWNKLREGQIINLLTVREMNRALSEDSQDLAAITFIKHPVRVKKGTETVFN